MRKGKKRVQCSNRGCKKHGYLTTSEASCLVDVGVTWMCPVHDDQRTLRCNSSAI